MSICNISAPSNQSTPSNELSISDDDNMVKLTELVKRCSPNVRHFNNIRDIINSGIDNITIVTSAPSYCELTNMDRSGVAKNSNRVSN